VRHVLAVWISVLTFCATVVTGSLLAPATARAQVPWAMTVRPTVNPLAIGGCGAVWLTLLDSTGKDVQRGRVCDALDAARGAAIQGILDQEHRHRLSPRITGRFTWLQQLLSCRD
jgi:hypothetical protein